MAALLAVLAGACAPRDASLPEAATTTAPASGPGAARSELTVFAAASLAEAFQEIGAAFERANPEVTVTYNFGASSQLRTQLEQGARADVFASADQAQMERARTAGVLAGAARVFARNALTLITPRDNPKQIQRVQDLANPGVKVITTRPGVPIGQYTQELLDRASRDAAFGADFRARVERNIVSREENVRQMVAKVQLGEADAAVCYTTDVTPRVRGQVQQVPIPDALQPSAVYPIAVTRGRNQAGGQAFTRFVLSAAGQDVLARWGFAPAGDPAAAPALPMTS